MSYFHSKRDRMGFVEPQYNYMLELDANVGRQYLGLVGSAVLLDDPRRLTFLLSRYKFVAKMFDGLASAVEIGCGDATGTPIVRQTVPYVLATDIDPVFIADARARNIHSRPIDFEIHDFLASPLASKFPAAYALDVLEHIEPADEDRFLSNICQSLVSEGVAIMGMPSLESQIYASQASKEGHVNCKTGADLKLTMKRHFKHVFLFSMNDEVVHTGFTPMAHYLLALGVDPIDSGEVNG